MNNNELFAKLQEKINDADIYFSKSEFSLTPEGVVFYDALLSVESDNLAVGGSILVNIGGVINGLQDCEVEIQTTPNRTTLIHRQGSREQICSTIVDLVLIEKLLEKGNIAPIHNLKFGDNTHDSFVFFTWLVKGALLEVGHEWFHFDIVDDMARFILTKNALKDHKFATYTYVNIKRLLVAYGYYEDSFDTGITVSDPATIVRLANIITMGIYHDKQTVELFINYVIKTPIGDNSDRIAPRSLRLVSSVLNKLSLGRAYPSKVPGSTDVHFYRLAGLCWFNQWKHRNLDKLGDSGIWDAIDAKWDSNDAPANTVTVNMTRLFCIDGKHSRKIINSLPCVHDKAGGKIPLFVDLPEDAPINEYLGTKHQGFLTNGYDGKHYSYCTPFIESAQAVRKLTGKGDIHSAGPHFIVDNCVPHLR